MNAASNPSPLSLEEIKFTDSIYRDLVNRAFPVEFRIGFALAYIYSLGSPRIAGLLSHTGLMEKNPRKRSTDTMLLQYELIHYGLGSETGDKIAKRFAEIHGRWAIDNYDYLGALATFIVPVVDVIEKYSPHTLHVSQREAICKWYRELGFRMGISDMPTEYDGFRHLFRQYERNAVRLNDSGQRILVAQLNLLIGWLPEIFRPVARRVLDPLARVAWAVIVPEPMRTALGLPCLPRVIQSTADTLVRAVISRQHRSGREWASFVPGGSYPEYPNGYTLDDLGPR